MEYSRRQLLGGAAAAAIGALVVDTRIEAGAQAQRGSAPAPAKAVSGRPADEPFGYSLNTSTIRGNQLDIVAEIAVAAKAGYHAIEPWTNELDAYVQKGGTLKDLGQRIKDAGLVVENVIAFNSWLSDDEATRAAGMETIKINMDKAAQIGAKHIATTPGRGRCAWRPWWRRRRWARWRWAGSGADGRRGRWDCAGRRGARSRCGTSASITGES
jgi:hypothetical protein